MAERQRRKAARESVSSTSASLVGDVTRKAAFLWPSRKSHFPSNGGLGNHTALKSRESVDIVPLENLEASSPASVSPSPTTSAIDENQPENPFANPSDPISPFVDSQQDTALMSPTSEPPTPTSRMKKILPGSKELPDRPVLVASSSSFVRHPPPKPLGLPPPRTPPPPAELPLSDRPPKATSPPVIDRQVSEIDEEVKETRWWHDWLCGCGEGTDRGGEHQVLLSILFLP